MFNFVPWFPILKLFLNSLDTILPSLLFLSVGMRLFLFLFRGIGTKCLQNERTKWGFRVKGIVYASLIGLSSSIIQKNALFFSGRVQLVYKISVFNLFPSFLFSYCSRTICSTYTCEDLIPQCVIRFLNNLFPSFLFSNCSRTICSTWEDLIPQCVIRFLNNLFP